MNEKPHVCVIGSVNMDLVTFVEHIPNQGETTLGGDFHTTPGGKGANQAIAASKLGAAVFMIGAIGQDTFGKILWKNFKESNINQGGIETVLNTPTGVATIILDKNDNRIIVSSGANAELTPEIIEKNLEEILNSDIILLQLEIPLKTVRYVVDLAHKHNKKIIINPAPYFELPESVLKKVDFFTPNEIELQSMKNSYLFEENKHKMIVTKGKKGVEFIDNFGVCKKVSPYKVLVKDTTGAGDTFNGAFAVELARTLNIEVAVKFANAAAALSITKLGAQQGMPDRQEVVSFLKKYEWNFEC